MTVGHERFKNELEVLTANFIANLTAYQFNVNCAKGYMLGKTKKFAVSHNIRYISV